MRWPVNASALMCDSCSSASWLRLVVRRTRCPSRISGYTISGAPVMQTMREPRVEIEHERGIADERERFAREIAGCLGDRLLDLSDVVRDARHQLAGGPLREEAGRLARGCGDTSAFRTSVTTRCPTSAIR